MDIDATLLEIPETEYQASIVLEAKSYKKMIDNFNCLDFENLSICCDDTNIKFSSEGLQGSLEVKVNDSQLFSYEIVEDSEIKNTYNLSFLNKMCQFKVCKYLSIQQSDNIPIEIKYLLDPDNNEDSDESVAFDKLNKNWFKFYLAPCTDDDDL